MGISEEQRRAAVAQLEAIRSTWLMKDADWKAVPRPLRTLAAALDADDPADFDEVLGWLENCGPYWIDGGLPDPVDEEKPAPAEVQEVLAPLQDRLTDPPAAPPRGDGSPGA
ncbi:CATRA system-associated protein [Streptomyces sp. NPDC055005]